MVEPRSIDASGADQRFTDSSKKAKSLRSTLGRVGGWGALDQLLLSGSSFIVSVGVARTGGPEALGVFVLAQSGMLFLSGLVKAGIGDPLVVEAGSKGQPSHLKVSRLVLLGHVLLSLALAAIWVAIGIARDSQIEVQIVLLIGLAPFSAFYEFARSVRLASLGEIGLARGDAAVALARVLTLLLIPLGMTGAGLGMMAMAAGSLAAVGTVRHQLARRHVRGDFLELWKVGRWYVGESLLFAAGAYGFWIVAVPRAGTAIAGHLRAVQQLFAPIQSILVGLSTILLARLAASRGRFVGSARWAGITQVVVVGVWAIAVVAAGPAAVTAVFGGEFAVGRLELALFGLAAVAGTAYGVSALQLRAVKRGKALIRARAGATVVGLGGLLLFGTSFRAIAIINACSQLCGFFLAQHSLGRSAEIEASEPKRSSMLGSSGSDLNPL